jgi:hypothetical protein
MGGDDSVHLDKPLSVPGGFEASHLPPPLTRRLMIVFRPVIQIPVLSMSNVRHHYPLGGGITAQLVRNDHAWSMPTDSQQPAEETQGSESITLALDQDIDDDSMLIDGSPEIVGNAVDLKENLIQMPFVAGPSTTSSQATSELSTELVAPAPDRFIAHQHAPRRHHLFHISEANTKSKYSQTQYEMISFGNR